MRHKQQIAAIDPTGAWWGLRSSATGEGPGFSVVVFGGDHADVTLEPHAGRMLARALVEHRFSAMFDVGLMLTDDQIRFTSDFASELLRISRNALHLYIDEADRLAGLQWSGETTDYLPAYEYGSSSQRAHRSHAPYEGACAIGSR